MTKRFILLLFVGLSTAFTGLFAQDGASEKDKANGSGQAMGIKATPRNMFEMGLNAGFTYMGGDVQALPSYGVGLHLRKAMDYVFSLRGDFLYAEIKGADEPTVSIREFTTNWMSGSLLGVISLNSLNWNKPIRSTNLYVMAGAGGNRFTAGYTSETIRKDTLESAFAPHAVLGGGISFRVGKSINIGLEEQAYVVFGANGDRVDGINLDKGTNIKSSFRDILTFTNLSINFNLGNAATRSEPLYWINPLENVMNDVEDIKKRVSENLADADQDGVLDALDQELNTPAGAIVDTKGRTLDSDRDGIPDYKDREPFYTPADGEMVDDDGVVTNPKSRGGGVTEDRVRELIDQALQQNGVLNDNRNSTAEWFLPMIHFGTDNAAIKYSDYGNLASVARTLRSDMNLSLVVTGYADATGKESYNNQLSYNRALAVVEHLVKIHNIDRSRLLIQWKGSNESLVPVTASFMNRRVEFRVAVAGDTEMNPPGNSSGGY